MENKQQKYYHMTVAGLERDLPICPLNDSLQIAGFVIFGDPELTTACAKELNARVPEYDYAVTAEAKGIPLVHEMARLDGNRRYVLARKAPKLYMTGVFGVEVKSITTAQSQHLYKDVTYAELMKGKHVPDTMRFIVVPATNRVFKEAIERGYIKTFIEAGAVICHPCCGLCCGMPYGLMYDDERILSTANRNFIGRQGTKKTLSYLCSPAVAAATALAGVVSDPRTL